MQLLNTYGMYAGREVLPGYDPLAQRQEAAAGRRTSSGALPGKSSFTKISLLLNSTSNLLPASNTHC